VPVEWRGPQVLDEIEQRVNANMIAIGRQVVQIGQRYAPKKTGRLAMGMTFDYNLSTHTLVFVGEAPYDIFVEYGTRNQRPQPHWRPALNTVGSIYGINLELAFANVPYIHAPVLAQGAKFHVPSTLTAKQRQHVKEHLVPASQRHFIGNVSRTKMHIRKHF
jgi:hypothetical protein